MALRPGTQRQHYRTTPEALQTYSMAVPAGSHVQALRVLQGCMLPVVQCYCHCITILTRIHVLSQAYLVCSSFSPSTDPI